MTNDTGGRVRTLRMAREITQAELAAMVGVSKSYLSHIEAGRRAVSPDLLRQLAEALNVPPQKLQTGTPADLHEDTRLRLAFAEMSLRHGDRDLASQEFAAIQELARRLPLERFLDEATWGFARAEEASGRLEKAIMTYEELLDRPVLSPAVPRAAVSVRLVMAYSECGDLGRAIDIGEQALVHQRELDPPEDASAQVELISTVAGCYLERGDLMRAQLLIEQALARAGEDGAPRARAAAAWNAAVIAQARHDSVGARRHADRALALYSEIDNARGVAMLRVVSAALRLRQQNPDAEGALPDLQRALEELRDVGSRLDLGYARTEQARAYLLTGDLVKAGEVAHAALDDVSAGERLQKGQTLLVLAHVATALGDADEAVRRLQEAAAALAQTDASRQAGTAWRELGEAYVALGRQGDAIDAFRRASDLAGATYNPWRPALAAAGNAVTR